MLRTFHHRQFTPERLVEAKRGRTVSVCLPARDEAETVGRVVEVIRAELMDNVHLVDELVVIDDGSSDATVSVAATAGAEVVAANAVLAQYGHGEGKGQALWKGVHVTSGDLIVFCDTDVSNFGAHFVTGLLGPLLASDDVALAKAFYRRPLGGIPDEGGRVTELVARPLISLLFPHLAPLVQPLAGECAGRRDVLEHVGFVEGYGVDLGLLIDVAVRCGPASLVQVDLGTRVHRNRPLAQLAPQATAIVALALARAGVAGPAVGCPAERPPLAGVPAYRKTA